MSFLTRVTQKLFKAQSRNEQVWQIIKPGLYFLPTSFLFPVKFGMFYVLPRCTQPLLHVLFLRVLILTAEMRLPEVELVFENDWIVLHPEFEP